MVRHTGFLLLLAAFLLALTTTVDAAPSCAPTGLGGPTIKEHQAPYPQTTAYFYTITRPIDPAKQSVRCMINGTTYFAPYAEGMTFTPPKSGSYTVTCQVETNDTACWKGRVSKTFTYNVPYSTTAPAKTCTFWQRVFNRC